MVHQHQQPTDAARLGNDLRFHAVYGIHQFVVFLKGHWRVGRVFRVQLNHAVQAVQPLDVVFVVDDGQHDMPVPGLDIAVHHQQIPIVDVGADYGIADHPEKEGRESIEILILGDTQ